MKTATLKQAKKVLVELLDVLEDVPSEQLQEAFEGGYFSDLMRANFDQMNRDDFRRMCGLHPVDVCRQTFKVLVDYTKSLKEMIEAGQYDWGNNDITSEHFHIKGSGQKEVEITLFHFNRVISSEDAIAEMAKVGYRPAQAEELLALGAKEKELQKQFPIVALGSVWRNPFGDRYVLVLHWSGDERRLSLLFFEGDWSGDYRFAAVRK